MNNSLLELKCTADQMLREFRSRGIPVTKISFEWERREVTVNYAAEQQAALTAASEECPPPPVPDQFALPSSLSTIDGIVPLSDIDICPVGIKFRGRMMKELPAEFLVWLMDQGWLKSKYPRVWAYIMANRNALNKEMPSSNDVSY